MGSPPDRDPSCACGSPADAEGSRSIGNAAAACKYAAASGAGKELSENMPGGGMELSETIPAVGPAFG
jgi:hypothetical protein